MGVEMKEESRRQICMGYHAENGTGLIYKTRLPMKNMARGKETYISYPCRNILHSNDCRRRWLTVGRNLQRQRKTRENADTSSNAIFQVLTAVMLKTHVFWNFGQC
jgi:hypothetical protein